MFKIISITATEIIDSRGLPTVQATCTLASGSVGVAMVPSGASTGVHEALELRDGDAHRYGGKGVLKAVGNVNIEISEAIARRSFDESTAQQSLDELLIALDGTPNKTRLGANAILAVSMAFARAAAQEHKIELYEYIGSLTGNHKTAAAYRLPQPAFNVINGGKHADSGLDIQEFMIIPIGFDTVRRKVQAAGEVIVKLKDLLHAQGYSVGVGDEGGFAPKLPSNEAALDVLVQAITAAGYSTDDIKIGIDAAASSFYTGDGKTGKYQLKISGVQQSLTSNELIEWYQGLAETYPIISLEDPLAEDDWDGFEKITELMHGSVKIVGDDLLVTNVSRIKTAIEQRAATSVLIKLNQIGTVTETLAAIALATEAGMAPFISHRSGETTDTFIADLAVGTASDFIKAGSLARGERVCKYNRLMEIEEKLG